MIIYRIILFGFLCGTWLFLGGFDESIAADSSASFDGTQVTVESESIENKSAQDDNFATIPANSKKNINAFKVNEKKRRLKKSKHVDIEIHKTTQPDEFVKPLDLSVPLISLEPAKIKNNEQDQLNGFFDSQSRKRSRALELNGNFLMSPEPEVERRKTVDGAGISINVKPD